MEFSQDQLHAIHKVCTWIAEPHTQTLSLGGYAGTGKTTLIREVLRRVGGAAHVCAFTGKAAHVLQTKGVGEATTIHRLIYQPAEVCADCGLSPEMCEERNLALAPDPDAANSPEDIGGTSDGGSWAGALRRGRCPRTGVKLRFIRCSALDYRLIIVDEASMLNRRLQEDLESFGNKVLYVGDHGQLEPIGDDPGIMHDPDVRLEEIHRQAAESPVIRFAHTVREGFHPLRFSRREPGLQVLERSPPAIHEYDAILCGFNKTRVAVNQRVRQRRGYEGKMPCIGERVICLRNDAELGIFNGMQATVTNIEGRRLSIVDDVGNEIPSIDVDPEQFGCEKTRDNWATGLALFDFGYCMTVHKSQGSEWKRVCVLEQVAPRWSAARWRYTAATRASEELTYCVR